MSATAGEPEALRAAARFELPGAPSTAERERRGHIHDTFVVTSTDRRGVHRAVLQRIDDRVFPDPAALMRNVERVAGHLQKRVLLPRRSPRLLSTVEGGQHIVDNEGRWWRAWEFVEGTRPVTDTGSPAEAEDAARIFGELAVALSDLPPSSLDEVIPRFHDLALRLDRLRTARATDRVGRAGACGELADAILRDGQPLAAEIGDALAGIPPTIAHNDAKIDNVLFDSRSETAVCVVDLDTTMPGSLVADFGELVRSGVGPAAEDERDLERVVVDRRRFSALTRGYLAGTGALLGEAEIGLLPLGGAWLALENGARFLTDHLEGDVYYRVGRPGQNLDRARVQARLGRLLLDHRLELGRIVAAERP